MIRLFVTDDLAAGAERRARPRRAGALPGQRHAAGAPATSCCCSTAATGSGARASPRSASAAASWSAEAQTRPQAPGPDLDLVVALVKRARLETIVEKAAELGARRVRLAITERTNAERARVERLAAIATEAAEQTGRLDVPAGRAAAEAGPRCWPTGPASRRADVLRRGRRRAAGAGRALGGRARRPLGAC